MPDQGACHVVSHVDECQLNPLNRLRLPQVDLQCSERLMQ